MAFRNPEDAAAYTKSWSENNREKRNEITRRWATKHRREQADKQKQYYVEHPVKYLFLVAKQRARIKGIEFNIEESDIVIPAVCPVLGIPLFRGTKKVHKSSPTIDRIKQHLGYVKGNVHVISFRANAIKNDSTIEELEKLVAYLKKLEKGEQSAPPKPDLVLD